MNIFDSIKEKITASCAEESEYKEELFTAAGTEYCMKSIMLLAVKNPDWSAKAV